MSKYIITIHAEGSLDEADKEALENDLYDGKVDLDNYSGLELPSYVDIMEDK